MDLPAVTTPRLAARLVGPRRSAEVLHRGRDALYLELDGWCVGVVRHPAVRVPCALVLASDAEVDLTQVRAAHAEGAMLRLDGSTVRVTRFRDASVPRTTPPPAASVEVLRHHAGAAREELGPLADVAAHVGRGSGLTPLGDDVLAGFLATSYALGVRTTTPYDVRGRTTLLSATLVDCAARGEVLPEFRDVVAALQDPVALEVAAGRLAKVGHTSGAGLLLGAALCLDELELAA